MLTLHPRQWFIWRQLSPGGFHPPWRNQLMLVNSAAAVGADKLVLDTVMLPRPLEPAAAEALFTIQKNADEVLVGKWHASDEPDAIVAISCPDLLTLSEVAPWVLRTRAGQESSYSDLDARAVLERYIGTDPGLVMRGEAAELSEFELPLPPTALGSTSTGLRYEGIDAFLILRGVSTSRHETQWNIYRDGTAIIVRRASNNEIYWIAEFEPWQPLGAIAITRLTVNLRAVNMSPDVAIAEFDRVLRSAVLGHDVNWPLEPEPPQQIRDAWVACDPYSAAHLARHGADVV